MPTIEIVSVGAPTGLDLPKYETLAYDYESELEGHRGLFQHLFDQLNGVIVHLANKDLEDGSSGWFAGGLLNWDHEDDALIFEPHVAADVSDLMLRLLGASPTGELTFSSDYQFGPEEPTLHEAPLSLEQFWDLHNSARLRFNAYYRIRGRRSKDPKPRSCTA